MSMDAASKAGAGTAVTALLEGIKALGPARLAAMAVVALGTLGLLATMVLHGSSAPMGLLYADLDQHDAGEIVAKLDQAHIANQVSPDGSRVMVPKDAIARARLLLAKANLPAGGSIGYEIFDRSDGLTMTRFQQRINETRALEGELERSIRLIDGVRSARVHLVLPKREPFARDAEPAQASVLLTMARPAPLDRETVQAIVNLIAAAVPGLHAQNVSVIDNHGDVLARSGSPVGVAAQDATAEEIRRTTDLRLSRAVEQMLERSLGPGHVRAEASVDMNFAQTKEVDESYNPDSQVIRSQQTTTDDSKSTEPTKTVTVQNNLPHADAGSNPAGSQEQRREETTNCEISKTVRTVISNQPQITRISLAVMVDGTTSTGSDGKATWHPPSSSELASITRLVKTAIGFNAKRGDQVDVVGMRFMADDAAPAVQPHGVLGLPLRHAELLQLGESAIFGVIVLLALMFVLRPMVLRLTAAPRPPGSPRSDALPPGTEAGPPSLGGAARLLLPPAQPIEALSFDGDGMVNVAHIEGQMRASSIRKIAELAEKHPEDAVSIVRGWMLQAEAG